ncbi:hypothetical protein EVAR_101703_1 [Eumeta japonica]|uniref:Uncharacterized protein n=1 Tax=Eumeta variegata TaxID=151549 RepID=A0A4C1TB95_EUMVA|nr:hypothetical protein EVAR_101703_1 [Eumeta japonica]
MGRPTKRAAHRSHPYCKPLRSSIDHHIRLRQLLDHNDVTVGCAAHNVKLFFLGVLVPLWGFIHCPKSSSKKMVHLNHAACNSPFSSVAVSIEGLSLLSSSAKVTRPRLSSWIQQVGQNTIICLVKKEVYVSNV